MKKIILILLLSVSFFSFNLHAQSGRKTTEPKPTKDQTSKPTETDDGITNTKVSPEGETVEGDVIRFDTALSHRAGNRSRSQRPLRSPAPSRELQDF